MVASSQMYTSLTAATELLQWSFITLFVLFEVGSAICGAAQSSKMLIVGRAIAGIGAASLLNGSITIVSCTAPPEKRPSKCDSWLGLSIHTLVANDASSKVLIGSMMASE